MKCTKIIKKHIRECLKLYDKITFGKTIGRWVQVFLNGDRSKDVYFHLNEEKSDICHMWYYRKNEIDWAKVE